MNVLKRAANMLLMEARALEQAHTHNDGNWASEDEAKAIHDAMRAVAIDLESMCTQMREQQDEISRLRAGLLKARHALIRYGAHDGACTVVDLDSDGKHLPCSCGYEAAIALAAQGEQKTLDMKS